MLDPKAFVKGCSLVAKAIRTRADAEWDPDDFQLKFVSFTDEFPEVASNQFLWCCEKWIQAQGQGFLRFPTWKELMVPLYRSEAGLANRSWGPRPDLPPMVQFDAGQRRLLPAAARSVAPCPDPANAAAYRVVGRGAVDGPLLPEAPPKLLTHAEATLLTDEQWQQYLSRLNDGESSAAPEEGAGDRPAGGPVVNHPVQPAEPLRGRPGRGAAQPAVPRGERTVQGSRLPRP